MSSVRTPAVAGSFYAADPAELSAAVDELLRAADRAAGSDSGGDPAALVVPHAGHRCSGPVAASAYRLLRRHWSGRVRTVVVFGPAHFRDVGGMAVPACRAWSSPLGEVGVDERLRARVVRRGLARADDACHAGEHSVEVQLPFLQRALADGWSFLPVVARSVSADAVADCIDAVVDGEVGVLVSTDLSHYLDVSTAVARDRRTARAIVRRDGDAVRDQDACGAEPLRGLLAWARRHDLQVRLLDLGTSADTCSGPERVVGYGAFAVA
jgi:AmmeMemoRadiSam system protein B